MVRPDHSLSAATFELKSVEPDLNKRYGKSQKGEFGHGVKLKVATGKRLSHHRRAQRQWIAERPHEFLRR